MKAGDPSALRHDLDFLNFVIQYEDAHPERGELSYEDAVQLYMTYDLEWRHEVAEARQFRRFVKDNGVQLLTGKPQSG